MSPARKHTVLLVGAALHRALAVDNSNAQSWGTRQRRGKAAWSIILMC